MFLINFLSLQKNTSYLVHTTGGNPVADYLEIPLLLAKINFRFVFEIEIDKIISNWLAY